MFADHLDRYCARLFRRVPCEELGVALTTAAGELYCLEGFIGELRRPGSLDAVSHGRYRDALFWILSLADEPNSRLDTFIEGLLHCFAPLINALPREAFIDDDADDRPAQTTVSILDTLASPTSVVEEMQARVLARSDLRWIRQSLAENKNSIAVQFRRQGSAAERQESAGVFEAYLRDTPLMSLFDARLPFRVPIDVRGEHTAIVGGAGWGKTQLLQSIIAGDLELEDPPAMVIVDSTGAMPQRIQRLTVFNERLKDRLIIIDPELNPVPALNMFDVSNPRMQAYNANMREAIESEIIGLFNYVFSSIQNPLTARMQTAFAFMVRLLLSIPGANMRTLLDLLDDDPPRGRYEQAVFKPHIDKLDETTRHFFEVQYYTGKESGLREQIRARVFDIIKIPSFERMFASVNRIDFFTELNRGSIIVINTSESQLKDGSTTFGRYMIARVMAAAFERATVPPERRRPAFLIVDEAAPYFDETFEKLLTRVRQFRLGVCIAFQHLEQASEKLRSAIASSTAVKYAGGTGYSDSRWLSREMRVDAEFVQAQKRDSARPPQWSQFACYVRNLTDRAVSLTVPFYALENMPRMSHAEHAALLERNRARVSAPPRPPPSKTTILEPIAPPEPAPAAPPDAQMAALAEAYAELAEAMRSSNLERIAELRNAIIPALESKVQRAEPRSATASPDTPQPAATRRDKSPEGEAAAESEWRKS